jgi:cephalosporin-C deacetylase
MNYFNQYYLSYDLTFGYSRDEIINTQPPADEPADFAEFWQNNYQEAMDCGASDIHCAEIWSPNKEMKIFEVDFISLGGIRIGGWICQPENPKGGILRCHGYGNPGEPVLDENFTVFSFCMRGMGRSKTPMAPWQPAAHIIHNLYDREHYLLRSAAADIWLATSVFLKLYPEYKENLNYQGGSFAGGMGLLTVPWDKRFRTAYFDVPALGNHPLHAQFKGPEGSLEVLRSHCRKHPEVLEILRYFDSAYGARYLRIPSLVTPALFDPTVIPVTQFAAVNAIPASVRQMIIWPAGHFGTPVNGVVEKDIETAKYKLASLT